MRAMSTTRTDDPPTNGAAARWCRALPVHEMGYGYRRSTPKLGTNKIYPSNDRLLYQMGRS